MYQFPIGRHSDLAMWQVLLGSYYTQINLKRVAKEFALLEFLKLYTPKRNISYRLVPEIQHEMFQQEMNLWF